MDGNRENQKSGVPENVKRTRYTVRVKPSQTCSSETDISETNKHDAFETAKLKAADTPYIVEILAGSTVIARSVRGSKFHWKKGHAPWHPNRGK